MNSIVTKALQMIDVEVAKKHQQKGYDLLMDDW